MMIMPLLQNTRTDERRDWSRFKWYLPRPIGRIHVVRVELLPLYYDHIVRVSVNPSSTLFRHYKPPETDPYYTPLYWDYIIMRMNRYFTWKITFSVPSFRWSRIFAPFFRLVKNNNIAHNKKKK